MSKMTIIKRDTHKFTVTAKTSSGEIFDLTGYTMWFTAKLKATSDDADAIISSEAAISDPATGIGKFTLTPLDTDIAVGKDKYQYDVQISDGAINVYTIVRGTLTVTQDVRHAM